MSNIFEVHNRINNSRNICETLQDAVDYIKASNTDVTSFVIWENNEGDYIQRYNHLGIKV